MKNWRLFYPSIITTTILIGLFLLSLLPPALYLLIPGIAVIPFIILFIFLEKKRPFREMWNTNNGDFTADLLRTFLTLPSALKMGEWIIPVLVYYPVLFLRDTVGFKGVSGLPVFVQLFILLVLSEFIFYWLHRWSQENKTLWLFHAVHHGAERVYWANAGRFHFVDAFLTGLAYAVPIALLGPTAEAITILLLLSAISGFMEHVNVQFSAGWWNYIFNTAELHRWHHSEEIEESNTNYGKVLVIWDLIFGTHLYNTDTEDYPQDLLETTCQTHLSGN